MKKSKREWKAKAEEAISPAHFGAQRERLAAGAAQELFPRGANGVRRRAGDESFRIGHLAVTLLPWVEDPWVRAGLAAQYLDGLHASIAMADQEDVAPWEQQLRCAEEWLQPMVEAVLPGTSRRYKPSYGEMVLSALTESSAARFEPVLAAAA